MPRSMLEGILRGVKIEGESRCSCGYQFEYIGVKEHQPQPEEGCFTMCPNCAAIYILGADYSIARVPQREIPLHVLEERDYILATLENDNAGANTLSSGSHTRASC